MDASAAAPNFSFFALFMQADWVVKGVMIGLILASLGSWAVILDKLFRFNTLNRAADRFEEQVGGGRSLEDVAGEAGANPPHALPRMLQAALKEWREAKARPMTENQTAFLVARIDRILDTIIARETAKVEEGLGSLAIVATASPFIGLFGTVWGIMHAFQSIALSKNTSLAVVAPSIAEALFATAIGLIAAIPAYIAYNKFSTDAGKYAGRLEGFADDLSTAIQRRLTERV
ncbi:protein TolQ [Caulobacter sp. BP25]|uniref:protein TolQ n=1 Tax=Caulobacter sp. BP25 TaxID=2048900 RepID=UPI000C12D2DA|nr:protein TolQ [Caulobacter sp. BP25]PHY18289.1 protein TolQ [Caulobacter sp. BP25]